MNTEDFVTYEQALALKKLGFDEECYNYYDTFGHIQDNDVICNRVFQAIFSSQLLCLHNCDFTKVICDAPTLAQAQKWIRKKFGYYIYGAAELSDKNKFYWVRCETKRETTAEYSEENYNSPEEALSAGITECLKLLEN